LHARWKRAAAAHATNLTKLRNRLNLARARGQASLTAQAEQEIEAAWRAAEQPGATVAVPTAAGGGGDDESPPPPSAATVNDRERLLALAMGTHSRLGAASPVQALASEPEVLRCWLKSARSCEEHRRRAGQLCLSFDGYGARCTFST
jgi:hypothetical protein